MKHWLSNAMILLVLTPELVLAEDTRDWIVRLYGGYSLLDDQQGDSENIGAGPSRADVELDGGFSGGLGIAYRYSERWGLELAWEYRSHDAETSLANGERFDDGNYASNTFWLNGFFYLQSRGVWQPYLGAGVGYIEEIDIDLERRGEKERSFSDDGDVAWQVFAGAEYALSERWGMQVELRYSVLDDVDLSEESGSGRLEGLDYDPLTFQVGVLYRF